MLSNCESRMMEYVVGNLDSAYRHFYRNKHKTTESDDLWQLAHDWPEQKRQIAALLYSEAYCFSPVRSIEYKPRKWLYTYRTVDALVLKAIALTLVDVLPRSPLCHSYKGHGGVKKALSRSRDAMRGHILKTDVQDYYASIDHFILLEKLSVHLSPDLLRLIYKVLKTLNRHYSHVELGLPRGSPVSHVLGNFYLNELDEIFIHRQETQCYIRYMDDVLVLTDSKGALRRADKAIKRTLNRLNLKFSYQKSFIGRIHSNKKIVFLGESVI